MTKENWTDIHKDFGKETYEGSGETLQQEWEQANITKQETKEWIELGFKPYNYGKVKEWKNFNFSPAETKTWLEVGLSKNSWDKDWEFASWLRTNNHIPELVKNNLEQLRNDYEDLKVNNSQTWLEQVYPNYNIKELDIEYKNLKGELNLRNYQQLEWLDCSHNKLTNIILPTNPTSLKKLNLRYNNFNQDLSFLVPYTNLETLYLENNKFMGSLDYLSGMEQLEELSIGDTDINEVQIDKLPKSLKTIEYSTDERSDCKLTAIIHLLEPVRWGWCDKCKELNTSYKWCQPCAEQEWEQLTGQELINKFIKQQGKDYGGKDKLQWIPYEEFTDIKHLADGGFSKIYKAKWNYNDVVLKFLNNSQNITSEFLTEIANTKLVDKTDTVIECYGISQNPTTNNYLMVMEYMEEGNLREYLQNKDNEFSLRNKLVKLQSITEGLNNIHKQNLVHQDFHSGNILNGGEYNFSYITDLGLSRPVNHLKQEGKIFGVLPYVAPEVLRGKPYTQASDVYSFGIIAYELLTNAYPYPKMDDMNLSIKVCQGYRPNIDKVPIPQLLKDLIKRCWDADPTKRPKAEELYEIINSWKGEKRNKNTEFCCQYSLIEDEYNNFSQNTSYRIHPTATTTSKVIDTKKITKRLDSLGLSERVNIQKSKESFLKDSEEIAPIEIQEQFTDWTIIHSNFTEELIQQWQEHSFTFEQCRDWINVGLKPTDANFCAWLRDNKGCASEQVLNEGNLEQLNQEFFNWWQEQQQTHIEQPPK